jgi:RNA polymerase sigma factor (sigma-70 family)
MLDQLKPFEPNGEEEQIEDALEILVGDHQRTGSLLPDDLARLASKRDLTPDQIDEIAKRLRDRGIDLIDGTIPEEFDGSSCDEVGPIIPKLALLTPEDEKLLGHACRTADKLRSYNPGPMSGTAAQLIAQGTEARRKLILHNFRLVAWVANKYRWTKLEFADLFQEGMFGLMRAVDLFDPTLGYRFSTYATWWIEQAIRRGLDNTAETIRIPIYLLENIRRYRRMVRRLRAEFGVEPALQRLAASLEWTLDKTAYVGDLALMATTTMDAPISQDGQITLKDIIPDDATPSPERAIILQNLRDTVEKVLSGLTPREERIVRLRFGIGVSRDQTLEEIGQQFGVTRERIRQIESEALRRLKHPSRSRNLRSFLD